MDPKVQLGQRIKAARERSGKTVEVVAREAGITASSLNRITKGESDPGATTLAGIARAVGSTPDALLGFDAQGATALDTPVLPAKLRGYAQMLDDLPNPSRRAVLQLVEALLDARTASRGGNSPRAGTAGRSTPIRKGASARD